MVMFYVMYFFCWVKQCVEHKVDVIMKEDKDGGDGGDYHCIVNARDFFVPTQVIIGFYLVP